MKQTKSQTLAMIGIALLVIAGVIIAVSLSLPKIYDDSETTTTQQISQTTSTSIDSVVVATTADTESNVEYPLNLNTATVEELMTIDELGEKRAGMIVAYREQLGAYTSVSQIKDIKGIGDSLYEKVAPYLTV
jgi:competence protein ComEA